MFEQGKEKARFPLIFNEKRAFFARAGCQGRTDDRPITNRTRVFTTL